jgi:predicted PurR-regulated permease PerM
MSFIKKVLILAFTIVLMVAAYFIYQFLHRKLNPRKSFFNLVLFFLLNLLAVFVLIFLMSLVLYKFKEFFFKV